jgi:hypothetical protein
MPLVRPWSVVINLLGACALVQQHVIVVTLLHLLPLFEVFIVVIIFCIHSSCRARRKDRRVKTKVLCHALQPELLAVRATTCRAPTTDVTTLVATTGLREVYFASRRQGREVVCVVRVVTIEVPIGASRRQQPFFDCGACVVDD